MGKRDRRRKRKQAKEREVSNQLAGVERKKQELVQQKLESMTPRQESGNTEVNHGSFQ